MKYQLILFSLGTMILSCGRGDPGFTLLAGTFERNQSVVRVSIPESLIKTGGELEVVNEEDGRVVAVQKISAGEAVFLLDKALATGEQRKYRWRLGPSGSATKPAFQSLKTEKDLHLKSGGKTLLTYNHAKDCPSEGLPAYYCRSGFIHPLYSPGGAVVTDGFPTGHTHQHGLFIAWVRTQFRGDLTDFWNQQGETGTVAHRELISTASGPVFASFSSRLEQISLKHGPVLSEKWEVKAYAQKDLHLTDIFSTQKNITADTLQIEKYHYGGLGIRGNRLWNKKDSHFRSDPQFLTSEGKTRIEANHSRPKWTAMYGETEKGIAGVAVLDHPQNFRSPQPVRVHPEMPYFCLAPMVKNAMSIAPGAIYQSRYRIVTFDGKADSRRIDQLWKDYAHPLEVRARSQPGG